MSSIAILHPETIPASPELTTSTSAPSRESTRLLAKRRTQREIRRAASHIIGNILRGTYENHASPVMWRSRIGNAAVQAAVAAEVAAKTGQTIEFFQAPNYQDAQEGYTGPHSTYTAYRVRTDEAMTAADVPPAAETLPDNVIPLFPESS